MKKAKWLGASMERFLRSAFFLLPFSLCLVATIASAANLKGVVTNGTTGKPSVGDEVVLLKLSQGMEEAARTKTDAKGNFSFTLDEGAPHLVRVIHQNVTYHKQVPPGTSSADITVYDAAKQLDAISASVQVMRFTASKDTLQVSELYAVKNASAPPRTLSGDQTFEIELPAGAQLDGSIAVSGANGMPVNSAPVPSDKKKGHYFFVFPLRPGETRFEVSYHLPYTGEASFQPKALYALEHFVVVVPKSMQFTAGNAHFQPMPDETGVTAQVATSVKAGDSVAFKVAGTGEFPREAQSGDQGGDAAAGGGAAADARPGGGLGPPSEAPDPLRQYRWYILGGLAVAMAVGAFYVLNRPQGAPVATPHVVSSARVGVPSAGAAAGRSVPGSRPMLMEALKEELFQLEVDKQDGSITQADYEKAKAALDVVIGRALRRGKPDARVQSS
jgi:hypothetical protein